jgi:hypothetical protein
MKTDLPLKLKNTKEMHTNHFVGFSDLEVLWRKVCRVLTTYCLVRRSG